MKQIFKTNLIAAGLTAFAWFMLFGWSVVATVYKDHQAVEQLKKQIHSECPCHK
jgi:hypothetical protein